MFYAYYLFGDNLFLLFQETFPRILVRIRSIMQILEIFGGFTLLMDVFESTKEDSQNQNFYKPFGSNCFL